MFSLAILSASADTWKDGFDDAELDERWKPAVSFYGANRPPADWKVENGVLKGHWAYSELMLLLMEYPSPDYTIQVKCRIDKAMGEISWAGIVFHSYGPDNAPTGWGTSGYSIFSVLHDGLTLMLRLGSDWVVTSIPVDYKVGEWCTLKLVVEGANYRAYVNDELVQVGYDGKFKGGFVGLNAAHKVDVSFDDFMITDRVDDVTLSTVEKDEPGARPASAGVHGRGKLSVTWGHIKSEG
jgi:hypothetical protein